MAALSWLDRLRDVVVPLESAVPVVSVRERGRFESLREEWTTISPQDERGRILVCDWLKATNHDDRVRVAPAETLRPDLDHPQGVAYALRLIIAAGHEYEMAPKAACELWEDLCHGRLTDADRLAIADALVVLFGGAR